MALELGSNQRAAEQVADLGRDWLEPRRRLGRALERRDRGLIAVDGGDAHALGKPQREGADAREQIGDLFGLAAAFHHQRGQRRLAGGGRLQETTRWQRHTGTADRKRWGDTLRDQFAMARETRELE